VVGRAWPSALVSIVLMMSMGGCDLNDPGHVDPGYVLPPPTTALRPFVATYGQCSDLLGGGTAKLVISPPDWGSGFLAAFHRYERPVQPDLHPLSPAQISAIARRGCERWPKSEIVDVLYHEITSLPDGAFLDTATMPSCGDFAPFIDRTSGRTTSPVVGSVLIWIGAYLSGFDAAMYQRRVTGRTDDGLARVDSDDGFDEDVFRYCLDHPTARLDQAADYGLRKFEIFAAWHIDSGNTALDAAGRGPQGYRPPSTATLGAAMDTEEDTSRRVSLLDQLAAYDLLMDYLSFGHPSGAVRIQMMRRYFGSPFMTRVQRSLMEIGEPAAPPIPIDSMRYQRRLDRLTALPADTQAILLDQNSRLPGTATRKFESLESYKANLRAHVAIARMVERLEATSRASDLSQITDRAVLRTSAFQGLSSLQDSSSDTDAWTSRANAVAGVRRL
jgi:hypothetical protein